jgi:hypothetical protein
MRLGSLLQLGKDGDKVRIGLAHVFGEALLLLFGEEVDADADATEGGGNVVDEVHISDEFTTGGHKSPFGMRGRNLLFSLANKTK